MLLDFWATFCEPCHESIPYFRSLYERRRERGLVVVGVNEDYFAQAVGPYVRKNRIGYPVILDEGGRVQEAYGVFGIPTTFLIDRKGSLRGRWIGFEKGVAAEMEAEVEKLVREPS